MTSWRNDSFSRLAISRNCGVHPVGVAHGAALGERVGFDVQAGPDWSQANLERPPAEIVPLLLDALASRLGHHLPPPLVATAHRWRHARSGVQGSGQLRDPSTRLGLCSDWLLGPRVEAAWLSGTRLAAAILPELQTHGGSWTQRAVQLMWLHGRQTKVRSANDTVGVSWVSLESPTEKPEWLHQVGSTSLGLSISELPEQP